jgi:outer membrane protein
MRTFLPTLAAAALIAVPASFAQTAPSRAAADPPAASAPSKVAVLNVQAAMANTAEGKQAAAEMQSEFAPTQAQLDDLRKKIEDVEKRMSTGGDKLSPQEQARLERTDQLYQHQAQRLQEQAQEQANAARQDIVERIGAKMDEVLKKYAAENGYTAVIDSSSQTVVYAAESANITEAIIRLYDQTYPVKATAAPAKPQTPANSTTTPPKKPGQIDHQLQ